MQTPSLLRKENEPVTINEFQAEDALAVVDPAIQKIIEASQRWDAEAEAADDAHFNGGARRNQEIQDEQRRLTILTRARDEGNHTKESRALAEKRVENQQAKLDRLMDRSKQAKANRKKRAERMHTSRMLQTIQKAGFRPMMLPPVELPKEYSGDVMTALDLVREQIKDECHTREDELYKAHLTRDEVKAVIRRAINAKAESEISRVPVGNAAVVDIRNDGSMAYAGFDLPEGSFWEALIPLVTAHFNDRVNAFYDSLEERFDVEVLSMDERRAEHKALKARCDELERIEGELIRRAYMAGHEPVVRADMDAKNLFPLIVDESVAWEAPVGGFKEIPRDIGAVFASKGNH